MDISELNRLEFSVCVAAHYLTDERHQPTTLSQQSLNDRRAQLAGAYL
jgi:hypothetical protein